MIEVRWLQPAPADERVYLGLLDETERTKAWRHHHGGDRLAYAAAHALLRTLLSEVGDGTPAQWRFMRPATGKPRLVPGHAAPDLRFSLSHARGVVACAVAVGTELGVDVEPLVDVPDALDLARLHFSAAEARSLQALADPARSGAFLRLWTLKEAALKAGGAGPPDPGNAPEFDIGALASTGDRIAPVRAGEWSYRLYSPGGAFTLALAAAAHAAPARLLQVRQLAGA